MIVFQYDYSHFTPVVSDTDMTQPRDQPAPGVIRVPRGPDEFNQHGFLHDAGRTG